MVTLSHFTISGSALGATPGGAKDIRFFRMGARSGEIPEPAAITPEGLFSEHDLPLDLGETSDALLTVQSAAMATRFESLPEARYLAQLGLSAGLKAESFQRAPLNLVAVVDKSGSMEGEPLALVRASLKSVLRQLRSGDQLSIVLYGDQVLVHLPPTRISRAGRTTILNQIDTIESNGGTDMESGLRLGYQVARESKAAFKGTTRVMLFTDEQPNIGNTEAEGFMAMATAASQEGIGLTTIGVGVQFGAELATRVSSVRGGNLFFFPDRGEMKRTFAEDFDTMVTELAHEFSVRIVPARGLRIEGVFGVPGEVLRWEGDALVLDIATIFASRRKGAIYFALAPDVTNPAALLAPPATRNGATLANVAFTYRQASEGEQISGDATCKLLAERAAPVGLTRGVRLVDEYLALKRAAQLFHHDRNPKAAFRLASSLLRRLSQARDPELEPEVKLVRDLHNTLALLAGYAGEVIAANGRGPTSPLAGAWRRVARAQDTEDEYVVFWPGGVMDHFEFNREHRHLASHESVTFTGPLPSARRGPLPMAPDDLDGLSAIRYEVGGEHLRLELVADDRKSQTLPFKRIEFAELPSLDLATATAVNELSGLPPRTPIVLCGLSIGLLPEAAPPAEDATKPAPSR